MLAPANPFYSLDIAMVVCNSPACLVSDFIRYAPALLLIK
jgi:hypothetical protein